MESPHVKVAGQELVSPDCGDRILSGLKLRPSTILLRLAQVRVKVCLWLLPLLVLLLLLCFCAKEALR